MLSPSCSVAGYHGKDSGSLIFTSSQSDIYLMRSPLRLLFWKLNSLSSLSIQSYIRCSNPCSSPWPYTGLVLLCTYLCYTRNSRTGPITPDVSEVLSRGKGLLAMFFLMQLRILLTFLPSDHITDSLIWCLVKNLIYLNMVSYWLVIKLINSLCFSSKLKCGLWDVCTTVYNQLYFMSGFGGFFKLSKDISIKGII